MGKKRAIYYDTETTGIKSESDRIIEIAAYDPELDRTFEFLINPGISIPKEATAIHHITDEMVAAADNFAVIGKKFIEFCEGDTVLIAHNNDAFDVKFLNAEFNRHGLKMPQWNYLDSLKWARRYRPDLPRHSLQFLREIYGFAANNAHRALDDVIILFKVFQAMIDDLSIDQAFELLQGKSSGPIVTMPFGKHQGEPLEKVPKSYIRWLADNGALDKPENEELKKGFLSLGIDLNQLVTK